MTDLKPRTQTVYLMQSDDIERAKQLESAIAVAAAHDEAESDQPKRANDPTPSHMKAALSEFDAFMAEAEERARVVVVQALPRREYRTLRGEHPPREGNEIDQAAGFNLDAFSDVLVPKCAPGETPAFLDGLSDGQWSQLFSAAVAVNEGGSPNPKVRLSSQPIRDSSETSESPARLG